MRAYNFQKRFAPQILDGSKPHTIRARRKDGYLPIPGEVIRLYTGMRTKQCQLLREVEVVAVRPIIITFGTSVVIDATPLTFFDACALAVRDGFKHLSEFQDFFKEQYGDVFNGYLIEWKP